ncbi:glycosyltransferase family 2 protein [Roseococcus sp. DSY-14]|uniref:glycosyltransferase family 2 protein n=1 Tax=Roseococcus sp. DSY-14 TaxID=3369650 RepID=UPI00387B8CC8
MSAPLLSYIVLSYNYAGFIGQTLSSILAQDVQDFEVVVVDDASSDASCAVVEGFGDPRIRLLRNERNLGGAGSYNRAVTAARGTWLVNLDADDWIEPGKAAAQLAAAEADPSLDIIGTWVKLVGADGLPHPDAAQIEAAVNAAVELNSVSSWIGHNRLCRSSTMVRRDAHLRAGLDDEAMVRAPDYELWTRFLAQGSRFGMVAEPLTCYRLHARGVTHADPRGTLLEMTWALRRNLLPAMEARGVWNEWPAILDWLGGSLALALLRARERERLFGLLVLDRPAADFTAFRQLVETPDASLEAAGRRVLAMALAAREPLGDLLKDINAYVGARDYWIAQAGRWEQAAKDAVAALEQGKSCEPAQRPIHRPAGRFWRFFRSS